MKNNINPFRILSFIVLILFQIAIGLLGFAISAKISHYPWLINMLILWLWATLGVYVGGIPFLLQKSFTPKRSLVRLATTALGGFFVPSWFSLKSAIA